jgi:putative hydrolase of the HAD superfamily
MTIEAVIFDFGGVISQPMGPILDTLESEYRLEPGTLMQAFYGSETWRRAEVGLMTYDEYIAACQAALEPMVGPRRAGEIWARWYAAFYKPAYMPGIIDLLEELKGKAHLALLSNASHQAEDRWANELNIAHRFEVLINSATIGVAKPDARAFTVTLERLGLPAEATFFIDDTLVNIESARALGIHAHHFSGTHILRVALRDAGIPV